jgi:hypothetical protein
MMRHHFLIKKSRATAPIAPTTNKVLTPGQDGGVAVTGGAVDPPPLPPLGGVVVVPPPDGGG